MNNKGQSEWIVPIILICTIGGCTILRNQAKEIYDKNKQLCESKEEFSVSIPLEALVGRTESEIHGRMGGSYFLFMGGISGSINSENNYILKYAMRDQYGVQLKTEKIENDSLVRINEVNSPEAKLTTIYKTRWYRKAFEETDCHADIKMKIFEVPKGTIKKEYNIDLNK